jgi:tol-pal system protein YbgF
MEEASDSPDRKEPAVAPATTARLDYRIDSLLNENRMLRQQIDALAAENRSLTARGADLEMRLAEAAGGTPKGPTGAVKTPLPATTTPARPSPPPPAVSPRPPAPASGSVTYDGALAEYRARRYSSAVAQFDALLAKGPGKDLEDNCWYWIGESQFALGKYTDAAAAFERVFGYSGSEKGADARYMLASSYAALGDTARAKEEYHRVITDYPSSPHARRAKEKLGRL